MTNPTKHFYTTGTHGVEYTTPEEMAAFLDAFPDEAQKYFEKQLELTRSMVAAGDYQMAKEIMAIILDALAIHDEHQGRRVLR